ncbi:MAG: hypothetical protein UY58_C0016G0004 [Candidatus Magasanikbacteria bacterium GW2011_GWA2_50_22]|uniref:Uncharacterized protein n=1 Tax=Candidatus Magasanikbacteria bacterium GW2011_GWA2_50_22 TaxID=1619043 RepID=A0A0G1YPF2_9BACT|nr:MAG: hypothetical protein UY58_C0016G0004 [Candidatus Magasanikbacteria bacterium GW2011_GWA2_50_22]
MQRYGGGQTAEPGNGSGGKPAKDDADHASQERERHGLGEKLRADVGALRADRFPKADLFRALGHGREHHIHNADTADHERNARNRREQQGKGLRDARGRGNDVRLVERREIGERGIGNVMPLQQQARHSFLNLRGDSCTLRRHADGRHVFVAGEKSLRRGQGNENIVVGIIESRPALALRDPDNFKFNLINLDALPTRVRALAEQIVPHDWSDDRHLARAVDVLIGQEDAAFHFHVAHSRVRRRRAHDLRIGVGPPRGYLITTSNLGRDRLHSCHLRTDCL